MSTVLLPVSLHYMENAELLLQFKENIKMLYISFTLECTTAQPQTLLIFRLWLLNTALPQTSPHFGIMQISTLVLKGDLSSLPALLPTESGQRQVWQVITQLLAHRKSPKFWGLDYTICDLLSLRLSVHHRLKGLKALQKSCCLSSSKAAAVKLEILHDSYSSNLFTKPLKVGSKAAYFPAGHYTSLSFFSPSVA